MEARMQSRLEISLCRWPRTVACVGALTLLLSAPFSLAQQQGGDDAGHQAFNNSCRTCHSVKDGDNRLGPNLHGIVGRKAGSLPDYNYSPSMKDAGFVWDQDKLSHFLAKPEEVVSGNKMQPYGGISKDEATRVIAYLQSAAQQR
ncbi:c-type cytochrome [Bradyrhizobium diazoefficiens]|nr:c-type cytochrome [Bradyrhizobium diazoefficiens]